MRSPKPLAAACVALSLSMALQAQAKPEDLQRVRDLLAQNHLQAAEAAARDAIQQNPKSAPADFLLGLILFREGKARESLAAYTEGAKWERPAANDLQVVASDYVLLKDLTDADRWFTEVAAQKPNDPEVWYLLGRTQYNENRFDEAIASFQRVLRLRPQDERAEDNLGLAYEGLGRTAEARAAYETAIRWQGSQPVDAQPYLNLGDLKINQGDAAGAIDALKHAALLAPDNARIHEELGRAYEQTGNLDGAQQELEAATRLAPSASALHFKLGQIYHRRGLTAQADHEFAICSRLNGAHSATEVPNPYQTTPSSHP